jgi:hypothetical protein
MFIDLAKRAAPVELIKDSIANFLTAPERADLVIIKSFLCLTD